MNTFPRIVLLSALVAGSLSSCLKDEEVSYTQTYSPSEYAVLRQTLNLPEEQINYRFQLPPHMAGAAAPVIHNAKATLGRVLFYDKQLSRTQTVSCASCHKQELAFSDDKAFSEGFDGSLTRRNSLALATAANFVSSYEGGSSFGNVAGIGFFWDERASSISEQSHLTIEDEVEMGMKMSDLVARIWGQEHYQILFSKAFGDAHIDGNRITEALQEFLNAFVSTNSRFDEGLNRTRDPFTDFSNYSQLENRGKSLFMANCSSCHGTDMSSPVFISMANNGLDQIYTDNGLGEQTLSPSDNGVFKIPFLRNIALTAPYMHDGRFTTLEEVVDHYSQGIQSHPNLDHRLRAPNGAPVRFNFSNADKAALVAFLKSLTDQEFITDHRFSDPFQ